MSGWSSPRTRRRRARVSSSSSRAAWYSPSRTQVDGEVAGRGQGVGVVLAEHPAAAGQGVLVQLAGRLVLAQLPSGRWRGCWPRPGCRGGPRRAPGGGGPGCPRPGRGPRRSGPCPGAPRRGSAAAASVCSWSSPSRSRQCWRRSAARSWAVRVSPRASRYQHALQAIQRRSGLSVAARSAASRCGISCAHRGQVTGLAGSPGSAGGQDRLSCMRGWRRPARG